MRACLIVLAALLVLAGCDRKPEKQITISGNGGKVTISSDNGHFAMQSSDGKTSVEINASGMGSKVKLPDFLALYPGAKVQSSVIGMDEKGHGGMVSFESGAAPADIIAFYKQKSAAAGFAETFNMQSGDMTTFASSTKDSKKGMQVVATKASGGSNVQLTWSGGE